MIKAENCFCDMLTSPVRRIRARVEVLEGAEIIDTCRHTDTLKSFSVERIGAGRFYGYGITQKANVKVIDTERTKSITTANALDIAYGSGCDFIYPHPLLYVSEVWRDENTNELSITAYDRLYAATQHTAAEITLTEYSIRTYAAAAALVIGLKCEFRGIEDETVLDTYYPEGANLDGTETVRAVLDAIAEATQTIYFVDNNNTLVFRRLNKDGFANWFITKDDYFTLDSGENRRLAAICHTTQLGDSITASMPISGTTHYIRDNPFLELRTDTHTMLDNALKVMGGITLNQFECDWRGNYLLELGDKLSLTTKDNEVVYSYLLDDVITYDGTYKQVSKWQYEESEAETADNPTNLGEALYKTFARVDKVSNQIDIVAAEAEANTNRLAAIALNTDSIAASVSRIQENVEATETALNAELATLTNKVEAAITAEGLQLAIQQELANGVDKVYTSTGFAFDADGLRISKTGSEMETTLDEDGLKVYRDNTQVLTADNTGVNGINMTVRQYLIVGGSRFEAYGSGRTGCFWID